MGIFNMLKDKISGTTSIVLTESGRREAEKYASRGRNFAILASLAEKSPQSVTELATETQIDIIEVKQRVKILTKQGHLRLTGGDV